MPPPHTPSKHTPTHPHTVRYYDEGKTRVFVLRCRRESYRQAWAAMTLVTAVGGQRPCSIGVLRVSGAEFRLGFAMYWCVSWHALVVGALKGRSIVSADEIIDRSMTLQWLA
jgi:hypothetical protein